VTRWGLESLQTCVCVLQPMRGMSFVSRWNAGRLYWPHVLDCLTFQRLLFVIGKQSLEVLDEGQGSVGWGMCSLWRSHAEMESWKGKQLWGRHKELWRNGALHFLLGFQCGCHVNKKIHHETQ
jgi:hypothetical protein